MSLQRTIARPAALATVLVLAGAAGAAAQREREVFEWRGRVDREVRLVVRDRNVDTRGSWGEQNHEKVKMRGGLPHDDGWLDVQVERGRGFVDVIEQPSRRNDYTAVIRIRDDRSGSDDYRIKAYWRPERTGWGVGMPRWPWDRGRGQDQGRDRDRDRDGDWNRGQGQGGWDRGDYGSGQVRWSGYVDDEAEIRIQGSRVDYSNVRGDGTRDVRADMSGQLPRRDVRVRIEDRDGRGHVDVIQQPSAWNGYMAIVRVRDPQSGYGRYAFDVTWN